ncbi:MAG: vWA domain-containing protein [Roseinatronobacter sp.]
MPEPRHSLRATAALQALTEQDPALAALSLWCRHRDSDTVELVETQGTEIGYGPGFAALPAHLQIGLAGHHILHVALQHPARMAAMQARMGADFDPETWQIACDAIVNETILAAGHALPRPTLTLETLLGQSSPAALAAWDAERLYFRLFTSGGPGRGPLKSKARDAGFRPDLSPGEGVDQEGAGLDEGDWRGHMARAMAAGRAAGLGLGALGFRLADLPRAQVAWEKLLRRWLNRTTLRRPGPAALQPARRWLALAGQAVHKGSPLPPWQANLSAPIPQPKLLIALDASGSIPRPVLARFLAETASAARRTRAVCTLVVFDTEPRQELALDPVTWRQALGTLDLPEGGGTDFRPVLALAEERAPSGLIVLTDLDGPFPARAPRLPVLWAVSDTARRTTAPFGQVISLDR